MSLSDKTYKKRIATDIVLAEERRAQLMLEQKAQKKPESGN